VPRPLIEISDNIRLHWLIRFVA